MTWWRRPFMFVNHYRVTAVVVALVALTCTMFYVSRQRQRETCDALNEGRAGARTAIGVLHDLVNDQGPTPTTRPGDTPPAPLKASPDADPAVRHLVDDLNGLIAAGGTQQSEFRGRANRSIDKALENLGPVNCKSTF